MSSARGRPEPLAAPQAEPGRLPVALSVTAYGLALDIEANDADLAERLTRHLPPGWLRSASSDGARRYSATLEDADGGGARASLYVNGVALARRSTVQTVLGVFESDVALHVAEMAPDRVFVHAGVVGVQGRAILLPGRSFSGKTTLVAELVRAGAEYYSDEYAVLDTSGGVHPYPGPLSIRRPGEAPAKYSVHHFGGRAGTEPLRAGLVVASEFRTGGDWRPRRLSPGGGVLKLLANTVPARRRPAEVLAALGQVVSHAPVFVTERGEASGVVRPILALAGWS